MTLQDITKLTNEEYRLCQFVRGRLGAQMENELALVLTGEIRSFNSASPGEITFMRDLAYCFGVERFPA